MKRFRRVPHCRGQDTGRAIRVRMAAPFVCAPGRGKILRGRACFGQGAKPRSPGLATA